MNIAALEQQAHNLVEITKNYEKETNETKKAELKNQITKLTTAIKKLLNENG